MVPKKSRMPRQSFESGGYRTARTPYFSLKMKLTGLGTNRIGVIVAKSVDKRAVRRNLLKRRAKVELLRVPASGKDFILMLYPKANQLTNMEFTKEIRKAVSQFASS
jgi:ribonuclease P protein component